MSTIDGLIKSQNSEKVEGCRTEPRDYPDINSPYTSRLLKFSRVNGCDRVSSFGELFGRAF
jgi:hypothetical protein